MTPERWQQVKETLATALEQTDTRERAAFLAASCANDTALRREVESLLAQPADEFEACAVGGGLAHPGHLAAAEVAGRRVGAYELVRELGRGGMGTVWLAKRADRQFEKLVAVKLLKRGTDTDEVLRRFHAERRILARLDHSNIARLLDGGTTEDGLPYFVMEYVEGTRLTDFVRERRLSIPERLGLFVKICGALEFAHQNLVVHRDLKPSNILITGEGEPKLLDFGIAKLLSPGDEAWEMTMPGRERLTPGYASPEQVRGEPVTTVSDVYALGALLYEVLAERAAHRFGGSQPTQTEILRVICQETPVRPSAAATERHICRQLRGDLDTIILRAMSKAPDRRYRGAGDLADDLRRYLEGRPVQARRDTLGYRTRKFLGRNKTGMAAVAIILITLLGGIVATTFQAHLANVQRQKAERRFRDVRKIANSLMLEFHNSIKDLPGALAARQLITQRALEYLDSLAQDAGDDLSLKSELATAYDKIGLVTFDVQQAINSHGKAATLNEELVKAAPKQRAFRNQLSESYSNLSNVMTISGDSIRSIDYARKAVVVMQTLAADNSTDPELRATLADRHLLVGLALIDAGDFKQALQSDLIALDIQQGLVAHDPLNQEALRALAGIYGTVSNAYEDAGDYDVALDYGRKSMDMTRDIFRADPSNARSRRDMWAAFYRTGRQLALTGDARAALDSCAKATELIEGLASADPADKGHRRWLALTYLSLGEVLARMDQPERALERYRNALAISEELFTADPGRVEARRDLAGIDDAMGLLLEKLDRTDSALDYLSKAKSLAEASALHDPQNAHIQNRLAEILTDMADLDDKLAHGPDHPIAARRSNLRAARDLYEHSLEIWRDLETKGMLGTRDAEKSEKVALEIAHCDAALDAIEAPTR
jgi:eukaryotic-like serine/threonine-protein kinase